MSEKGQIIKIAKGTMTDIADKDINYFSKNINTYAGANVNETANQGVFFGNPESAPSVKTTLEDVEFIVFENNVFKK